MNYSFALSSPVNGLDICSVDTKSNFKVAIITANFALPLGKDAAVNALIPGLLKRTCRKYPTLTEMNKHLAAAEALHKRARLIFAVLAKGEKRGRIKGKVIHERSSEFIMKPCFILLYNHILQAKPIVR